MSGDLYELVALGMRYFFAAIMVLIVARAWKITVVDSRRASKLRHYAPETGLCGEFLVVAGDGKRAREGMTYPVIREGLVGSSGKADVRIRSASVRRAHAFFERTETGLRVRAQNRARMYNARGDLKRETTLGDGDHITFGKVELMLVLTDGQAAPGRDSRADDLFDIPEDAPARRREAAPEAEDTPPQKKIPRRDSDEPDIWDAPPQKKIPRRDSDEPDIWDAPPQKKIPRRDSDEPDIWDAPPQKKTPRRDSDEPDIWDAPPQKKIPRRDTGEPDIWDALKRSGNPAIEPDEIFDSWDEAPRRKKGARDGDDPFDA